MSQPILSSISGVAFDPEFAAGASNAVNTCLRVQPTEKVTLITDYACREIAASIAQALKQVGCAFTSFLLEDLAPRPLAGLPQAIADDMETSDVSIFAVRVQRNELKSRMEMTAIVNRRRMRHAHMVNINRQIMLEGMRADFDRVDRLSSKVLAIVSQAKEITGRTAAGSDFTGVLNPDYSWLKTSGIISRDKWGNLPGGEIFTSPGSVSGVYVVDGVVGDYLCEKYGDLEPEPLTIRMKDNRITEVFSENKALEADFWAYTHTDENSDRVGEFAIGTNIELTDVIGQILQDEKFPGIHIAFGNPYGEHTGAPWYSGTHIDVVGRKFDIWVDGRQIMEKGSLPDRGLTMIPALREAFNRNFRPETYQNFLCALHARAGTPVAFRVAETPCFFPRALLDQMVEYGRDLILQLVENPEYLRASDVTVPPQYNVANQSARPMFLQVDFGLIRNPQGGLEPRLVELQAFPSLYGYQPVLAQQYIESYGLPPGLRIYLGGFNHETYQQQMRELIVGSHDPENVILLEIQPEKQKTLCDFLITQKELGIAVVDILQLKKRGEHLFYEKDGREIPVHRIYNRCIVDELERNNIRLPLDLTEPLAVEWAGHPNWYYRISKFSIPFLKHPCVPKTWLLDSNSTVPRDNENYLLKPLYSFAGLGIKFAPTQADVDSIPVEQRQHYMLQERLRFEPVIETPHGATQAEVRIMYVWPEGKELVPVLPLLRMGRGMMMGVDHNRNLEWVGGSAALWV